MFFVNSAWIVSVAASLFVILRLLWLGLLKGYPAVALFMAVRICAQLYLMGVPARSMEYTRRWFQVEALQDATIALMLYEVFSVFCCHHNQFTPMRRIVFRAALASATLLCLIPLGVEYPSSDWGYPTIKQAALAVRYTDSCFFIFTFLASGFFWSLERITRAVRYRRNLMRTAYCAATYLGLKSGLVFLGWIDRQHVHQYNMLLMTSVASVMTAWIFAYSRDGEEFWIKPARPGEFEQADRDVQKLIRDLEDG